MTIIDDQLVQVEQSQFTQLIAESISNQVLKRMSEFKNKWDLITTSEACDLLGISKPTLDLRVKEKCFSKYYLGDRTYFSVSEIQAYIKSNSK